MVKKKTSRQKVKDKASKRASAPAKQENASTSAQESVLNAGNGLEQLPQNMKRKIAKQMRFYARVQETQQALSATKAIAKKKHRRNRSKSGKTLNDLSSLAEFLPTFNDQTSAHQRTAISKLNCKSRQKLVAKETQQLAAVMAHPVFKSNPFSAIQQHLQNTLGPQAIAEVKPKNSSKKESSRVSKKGKVPKSAPSVSVQSMDT
eukprot:Gb_17502 [translate_table: standard]